MDAGDIPNCAGAQRPTNAAHAREVATVLYDGVDAPGCLGAPHEVARVIQRFSHRLFAQYMAARRQSCGDDLVPSRGHDNVEEKVRTAVGDERMGIAGDHRVFERELLGAGLGALGVDVGKAHDA